MQASKQRLAPAMVPIVACLRFGFLRLRDGSQEAAWSSLKALWCFLRALERPLGGSREALGRLLEASKRHLGPQTVKGRIFGRFLKKIGNFGRPSWRRFNFKNRIFWGSKRVSNIKLILKTFWHRFWDDFRRSWNVKNEQKRGRVALFLIFRVCNIRRCFGPVLGGSWGGFWELFGRFWLDFGGFKGVKFRARS